MPNPTAAFLVIGDEILSGRTRDINIQVLALKLAAAGIDLCEIRVVADAAPAIIAAVNALRGGFDHVFTSGGIGPTHDDITSDCIAVAFGVPIGVRADACAVLATHYADPETDLNEARLRMARIPEGGVLIDNPVSKAPGYTLGNVHVLAGVPHIFEAMLEGLMPKLTGGEPPLTETLRLDRREGDIAGPLGEIAARHPGVAIGSYPFVRDGRFGTHIVLRSPGAGDLALALADVQALI